MRVLRSKTLFAGLAAGFMGLALMQSAQACDSCGGNYSSFETTTLPSTYVSETSPIYVDRVVANPVMIGDPCAVERTLTQPVMINNDQCIDRTLTAPVVVEDRGWHHRRHHLLNLNLF